MIREQDKIKTCYVKNITSVFYLIIIPLLRIFSIDFLCIWSALWVGESKVNTAFSMTTISVKILFSLKNSFNDNENVSTQISVQQPVTSIISNVLFEI